MAKSTIPRADSAVIYDDDPEYLSEFRAAMLARGLSTATRNAYSQDVRLCIRLSDTPVNLWQSSDVRNHLMCLKMPINPSGPSHARWQVCASFFVAN